MVDFMHFSELSTNLDISVEAVTYLYTLSLNTFGNTYFIYAVSKTKKKSFNLIRKWEK